VLKHTLVIMALCCFAFAGDLDLVRIDVANKEEIKELDRMGVIINQVHPEYVVAEIGEYMYRSLATSGFKVELIQKNITEVYRQNSMTKTSRAQYLNYSDFVDSMVALATNHPEICHLDTLGYSHSNRLLLIMKVSDSVEVDETEPEMHFEGNIHGNEKIAWAVCFCMLSYLVENYPTDTLVQRLVDTREIWIAPLVNPDGYVANSRYNSRGVDLNRNWGWMWGNEYACGSDFFSENESWKFMEHFWRRPFTSYMSYHSGTLFISEPWSYTSNLQPPEQSLIRHLSIGYNGFTGYPYGQGSVGMYPINGCTKDYDYGCGGEMGWSIEVCNIKTPPADSIDVIFNRDRPAMMYVMHKAGQGIHGIVTDSVQGDPGPPLRALIYIAPYNYPSYSNDLLGDFHRFYLPGTYDVTVMSPGYEPKTFEDVVVPSNTADSSVFLDVRLVPNLNLPVYATEVFGSRYVSVSSNMTYPVWALGPHDNQAFRLDASKWIVLRFSHPVCDVQGNDLFVYRSSGTGSATVKISNDWRGSWQTLGTANSAVSEFDINGTGLDSVYYVRIEASNQFMLDAIEAPQISTGVAVNGPVVPSDDVVFSVSPTLLKKNARLTVSNPSAQAIDVGFFNLIGQEVYRRVIEPGQCDVSVSHLPAGVYFLRAAGSKPVKRIILLD
jgi:hypothetical protein